MLRHAGESLRITTDMITLLPHLSEYLLLFVTTQIGILGFTSLSLTTCFIVKGTYTLKHTGYCIWFNMGFELRSFLILILQILYTLSHLLNPNIMHSDLSYLSTVLISAIYINMGTFYSYFLLTNFPYVKI